jgi:hypothetical protein
MEQSKKRIQKKKPGRVIRITPDLAKLISAEQKKGETIPAVIKRLLSLNAEVRYALPSDLHETVADAKGYATLKAVRSKSREPERPIPVRVKI